MVPSLSELATSSATESSGSSGSNDGGRGDTDYERVETGADTVWTKQFPATAVRGTAVALDHRPDFIEDDDGNYRPDMTTMDFGVVLENPSLFTDEDAVSGGTIVAGEGSGDDFRVYDENDDETEIDADAGRVIFGSNSIFTGDVVDDFETDDDDQIYLKVEGSAGKSVVSTLDVKARGGAHQIGAYNGEDVELHPGGYPQHSGHLFEYNPDDDAEDYQTVAGVDPELRPDVEGRDVIVMIQRQSVVNPDYDGNAYWASVFAAVDDDRREELATQYAERFNESHADEIESEDSATSEKTADDYVVETDDDTFLALQPTDEFDRSLGNLIENGWIEWNTVSDESLAEAREAEGFE